MKNVRIFLSVVLFLFSFQFIDCFYWVCCSNSTNIAMLWTFCLYEHQALKLYVLALNAVLAFIFIKSTLLKCCVCRNQFICIYCIIINGWQLLNYSRITTLKISYQQKKYILYVGNYQNDGAYVILKWFCFYCHCK